MIYLQVMELYASTSASMREIWRTWPKVGSALSLKLLKFNTLSAIIHNVATI